MVPLIPLAVGAVAVGIGFTIGKEVAQGAIIPWGTRQAKKLNENARAWSDKLRKKQLDEIDPEI